jgi:hypothetical protein
MILYRRFQTNMVMFGVLRVIHLGLKTSAVYPHHNITGVKVKTGLHGAMKYGDLCLRMVT